MNHSTLDKLESHLENVFQQRIDQQDSILAIFSNQEIQLRNLGIRLEQIENRRLKDSLDALDTRLNQLEVSKRQDELVISNLIIRNPHNFDFVGLILQIGSVLHVTLRPDDIIFYKFLNRKSTNLRKCAAILVKFVSLDTRNRVMKSYLTSCDLSNHHLFLSNIRQRVYINDNLTPLNALIFKKAKNLFKQSNNKPLNSFARSRLFTEKSY